MNYTQGMAPSCKLWIFFFAPVEVFYKIRKSIPVWTWIKTLIETTAWDAVEEKTIEETENNAW